MLKENKSIKIISSKLTLNNDNNKEKKFNFTKPFNLPWEGVEGKEGEWFNLPYLNVY